MVRHFLLTVGAPAKARELLDCKYCFFLSKGNVVSRQLLSISGSEAGLATWRADLRWIVRLSSPR